MSHEMPSYDSFEAAEAAASPTEMVCGALLKSGEPAYFLMPRGIDQETVRDTAFQLRHGRPISAYERFLLAKVEELRPPAEAGAPPAVEVPA